MRRASRRSIATSRPSKACRSAEVGVAARGSIWGQARAEHAGVGAGEEERGAQHAVGLQCTTRVIPGVRPAPQAGRAGDGLCGSCNARGEAGYEPPWGPGTVQPITPTPPAAQLGELARGRTVPNLLTLCLPARLRSGVAIGWAVSAAAA
jgi:hypothetical protein